MSKAYYNEFNPEAAAWLRELIAEGLIVNGDVDERSIVDVNPSDIKGYTQHHFFAGIGVWSYALRMAGWPDNVPVCTASLPCQPFSQAGKKKGLEDERHLFPVFHSLSQELCFPIIFGEQVSSKDGLQWFTGVRASMEASGYICGGMDTCAAGVGAPHLRQRLYWSAINPARMGDANLFNQSWMSKSETNSYGSPGEGFGDVWVELGRVGTHGGAGETNRSLWSDCEWVYCADGKYRPIKSGISALVDGATARMGQGCNSCTSEDEEPETWEAGRMRIHGYGNAIVAQQAYTFISCVQDFLSIASA